MFTKVDQDPRTDANFRAKQYGNHQKFETCLTKIASLDMIKDFIVADELHILHIGVVKRLLSGWCSGDLGYPTKLTYQQQTEISKLLLKINTPKEINRDARSLELFACWKGQEFRNFLCYYGPLVLKKYLPQQNYCHFLKLYCAVRMSSNEKYFCHINVTKLLYDSFIADYKQLYGSECLTSNVHNLTHIVEDVKRFGKLSTISAYPFENVLGTIKRMIRGGKNPLQQIARRLTERLFIDEYLYYPLYSDKQIISILEKHNFFEITLPSQPFSLNTKFENMWFYSCGSIVSMTTAFKCDQEFFVEGYELQEYRDFFIKPLASSFLNVYIADVSLKLNCPKVFNISEIICKFVTIHFENNDYVFVPLLHSLK